MTKKIAFVKSGITGGHFAFQTETAKSPFTNKLTEARLVQLFKDDVVADIGAYVGEYSLFAAKSGAKKVLSYEPTPDSFKLLTKNSKGYNIVPLNMAVTGDSRKTVELHISPGIGVTNSITKKSKFDTLTVNAIQYEKAVKGCTVVKIDCEGAEYSFNIIQPNLRGIIIEFHPIVGVDWVGDAKSIMSNIKKAGYKTLAEPKFANGWDMHGAWIKIQ